MKQGGKSTFRLKIIIIIVTNTVDLVKYSRQLFTKNLQHSDCHQHDCTIKDVPLQTPRLDESFCGYAKLFSKEQPKSLPSCLPLLNYSTI